MAISSLYLIHIPFDLLTKSVLMAFLGACYLKIKFFE